jgi:ribulose-5-phosphate 4-epimerase/fuculose-1-phosphate aldolase
MRVQQQCVYHDYEGIALDMSERERMAASLGKTTKVMILRNHGLLTLGATVREAFELMYYLDCACQIQVDAMAGGLENVQHMSQGAAATATEQFERDDRPSTHKDWPALLRLLERRGVDYLG